MSFAAKFGVKRPLPQSGFATPNTEASRGGRAGSRAGRPRATGRGAARGSSAAQLASLEAARAELTVVRAGRLMARTAAGEAAEAAAHVEKLRACLKQHLGAVGLGVPVTELQAVVALSAFLLYNADGKCSAPIHALSTRAKAQVASFMSGRSEQTVEKLWQLFREEGRIVLEQPGARGPRRANEEELIALEPEPQIKAHVREVLLEQEVPGWVTRRSLQASFATPRA